MKRLVFPFEITHARKAIVKDREKIFAFAQSVLADRKSSRSGGGRGLFMQKKIARGQDQWLRASELPQPMPPTHFLRIAGQSARKVADDGSTEGGITESLAMMNGKFSVEQAAHFASRVRGLTAGSEKNDVAAWVEIAFRLALARPVTDEEIELGRRLITEQIAGYREQEKFSGEEGERALQNLCHMLLNTN